jgi:hypothetical protein
MKRTQDNDEDRDYMKCSCGSGLYKDAEYDARGIFLTYACNKCRKGKLSRYRQDVLTDSNYWHDEPIDED